MYFFVPCLLRDSENEEFQACPFPLGICHPVGPGGGEFVRKPLPGSGALANSSRSG